MILTGMAAGSPEKMQVQGYEDPGFRCIPTVNKAMRSNGDDQVLYANPIRHKNWSRMADLKLIERRIQ